MNTGSWDILHRLGIGPEIAESVKAIFKTAKVSLQYLSHVLTADGFLV